ncbi:hypothetical protein [Methylobacterium sp. 391_Methyba4]|uniref:hypothetical protein n=1 Tax=Methylobacterium sp. 391_Methyba4 TaxID=3038924 RepID=UPI0024204B5A|nr:hypothetical protein [Methylobacterium sp. 391_Methyba4]WFS07757.1 hypothetical protein P9K36_00170 [Methylobacterium sp. 391_Methyba4]
MGRSATRPAKKSGAALLYERQRRAATAALAAQAAERAAVKAAPAPTPEPGTYRIAELREGQCRFACTSHGAARDAHRFCGEPVAWKGGKPTSWCRDHLLEVSGAPGRHAGGASLADVLRAEGRP